MGIAKKTYEADYYVAAVGDNPARVAKMVIEIDLQRLLERASQQAAHNRTKRARFLNGIITAKERTR